MLQLLSLPEGATLDESTDTTVRLMASFARSAQSDAKVQAAARFCRDRFGRGARDLFGLAAAVFWWLKHCITFQQDYATMFQLGLKQQHDFVTDPRVLVRMRNPKEDCDGFATMGAALCGCLGIPYYFAAAATEPSAPRRWSHVWLIVGDGRGRFADLDGSHGSRPGWGVPQNRRYLFGIWDANGVRVR